MYRPATFFIDIDRPFEDKLFDDLNNAIISQQAKIGAGAGHPELNGQPLKRHPTNKFCVYSPWYMVDVGAESESDWENNDYGTGIFPILEKHGYQFTGSAALFNVGKAPTTSLMITFEHEDGPSEDWKPLTYNYLFVDTSVAKKEYDEMMDKFKKVEEEWNQMYPDPEDTSDDSMNSDYSDEDSDEDTYGYWNKRSFPPRSATIDKKAKARQILGINKLNPSEAEIRRAYRKKARENHPDKGGKPGAMKEINNARDILLPSKFMSKLKF